MSAAFAFPYSTIPAELCELGQWERFDEHNNSVPVEDHVPGWDYDSKMELGRTIALQPDAIVESLGLVNCNATMAVVVTAETGPTGYRRIVFRSDVPNIDAWESDLRFEVNSVDLAQRISLATEIILAKEISDAEIFSANQIGSRLFREIQVIQLEGSLGRFPMEMLDFGKGLPYLQAPGALWYLDWDPSRPESQFLGTVLLYVNSAHPEISNLVQAAEPTVLSILRCEIIRAMCQALLQSEEFLSNFAYYEMDTVGGQVREWLLLAFGDEKPELMQSRLSGSPGRFEARIQSVFS